MKNVSMELVTDPNEALNPSLASQPCRQKLHLLQNEELITYIPRGLQHQKACYHL